MMNMNNLYIYNAYSCKWPQTYNIYIKKNIYIYIYTCTLNPVESHYRDGPTGHKIPMFLFAIITSSRVSSFLSSVVNKQNADTQKTKYTKFSIYLKPTINLRRLKHIFTIYHVSRQTPKSSYLKETCQTNFGTH